MFKNTIILTLLIILIFSSIIAAETVNLELEYLEYKEDHMNFKENTIYKGDIKITSDSGEYYENEKKIKLKNNIKLISNNYKVTSLKMNGFLEKNKYIFTKNVIAKNKNKENKDFILKTEELIYNSDSGNFTGNKNIKLNVDNRKITGEKISYIKKENKMIITDNVNINNQNSKINTEKIIINLNKDSSFKTKGKTKIKIEI